MTSRVKHEILSMNQSLVERLDHSILIGGVDVGGAVALTEPEHRLDN
jgi:hypothetical protein